MPITLGMPKVYLRSNPDASFVQFHYVKDGQIVELFGGRNPRLSLKNSDIILALGDDRTSQEENILAEASKLLAGSRIEISRGERRTASSYYFEVVINPPVKGLEIDPTAFASGFWFVD